MTLNEISSTIRNRISDGLSGNITNVAYSLEQIEDEIDLMRAALVEKFKNTPNKVDPRHLTQTMDRLCVECKDLGNNSQCLSKISTGMGIPSVSIPAFVGENLYYVGTVDKMHDFKIYFDIADIENHVYRPRTSKKPFVWADLGSRDSQGFITLWFFNMGPNNPIKYISTSSILEKPMLSLLLNPEYGEMEYPAPAHIIEAIIEGLVNKYVFNYRKLNIPPLPNTQADPVT